jgi:outer membrane protein
MSSRLGVILIITLFSVGALRSQPIEELDLSSALRMALENNLEVRLAKIDYEIAKNANHLGEAGFLPTLNADVNAFQSSQDLNLTFFSGETISQDNAASRGISGLLRADWTLFDGFRMFATRDRLNAIEEMGKQQFRLKAEEIIALVINEYMEITEAEKLAEFYRANASYTKRLVEISEDKIERGLANRTEYLRLSADYFADSSMVIRHETEVFQRKMNFCYLLGIQPNDDFQLSQVNWEPDFTYDDLMSSVSMENPELIMQRLMIRSAEDQLKEERSAYMPTLGTFGEYLNNRQINDVGILERNFATGFNYGLRLQWTLFNANRTNRLMQERRFVLSQMQLTEEDMRRRLEGDVMRLWKSWLNYRRIFEIEEAGLAMAEENLKLSISRFERGIGEDIDVREARRNLTQAQLRLLQSQTEMYKTASEILKISGKGMSFLAQ